MYLGCLEQTVQRIVSQHGVNFSNFEAGSDRRDPAAVFEGKRW